MGNLENKIINTKIAENTTNRVSVNDSTLGIGIKKESMIMSNIPNSFFYTLSQAIQYLQFTVGLYSNEAKYTAGNICKVITKENNHYTIRVFRRNSNNASSLAGNPPLTATETVESGITIFENPTAINQNWDEVKTNFQTDNNIYSKITELERKINNQINTTIDNLLKKERDLLTVLNVSNVKQAVLKLKERTLTGDFGDLRLGDYIEFSLHTYGNQRFEIVAFDHYLNRGNPTITQHHITFMSVNILEKRQMHSTNENRYYYNRDLATYLNGTVKGALVSAIGVEPLSLPLQWDVGPTNGGGVAVSLQVYIPQIEEMLGTGTGWGTYNTRSQRHADGDTARAQWGKPTHSSQFPLFVNYPYKIHKKYQGSVIPYWSSTPCYDAIGGFSVVGVDGVAANGSSNAFDSVASLVRGVPLAFNL